MSHHTAAQEAINEAGACIWNALKIDPGTRGVGWGLFPAGMKGDVEDAYNRLGEARDALNLNDIAGAQRAVAEALDLLRSEESRLLVEDTGALDDAIFLVAGIRLN